MNYKSSMRLLGCSIFMAGFISLGADVLQLEMTHAAPTKSPVPAKSRVQPQTQPAPTPNNIKLLGYGLFLLRIGLKPLESARQCDLKLSKRLAEPAPIPETQAQQQSID